MVTIGVPDTPAFAVGAVAVCWRGGGGDAATWRGTKPSGMGPVGGSGAPYLVVRCLGGVTGAALMGSVDDPTDGSGGGPLIPS